MTATSWDEARRLIFERWRFSKTVLRFVAAFGGTVFFTPLNGLSISADAIVDFDDKRLTFFESHSLVKRKFATVPLVLVTRFEFIDEIGFPSDLRQHISGQGRLRAACIMTIGIQPVIDIGRFALCEFEGVPLRTTSRVRRRRRGGSGIGAHNG